MAVVQFDIDGVLADFVRGFLNYITLKTNVAVPNLFDANNPRYGTEHIVGADLNSLAWESLKKDPFFWEGLPASATRAEFARIDKLQDQHDVYFATNRPGLYSKQQTEHWLMARGIARPTVVVTARKGEFARAVNATYSIEDKAGNAVYIGYESPTTQSYLLARAYNQFDPRVLGRKVVRVDTVSEFLNVVEAS